jgi:ATP synthase protein I
VLIRLLKAEAVKIVIIVLLLWLTFKFYSGLVPLALIIGLAGAALFSGAAIFAMNDQK